MTRMQAPTERVVCCALIFITATMLPIFMLYEMHLSAEMRHPDSAQHPRAVHSEHIRKHVHSRSGHHQHHTRRRRRHSRGDEKYKRRRRHTIHSLPPAPITSPPVPPVNQKSSVQQAHSTLAGSLPRTDEVTPLSESKMDIPSTPNSTRQPQQSEQLMPQKKHEMEHVPEGDDAALFQIAKALHQVDVEVTDLSGAEAKVGGSLKHDVKRIMAQLDEPHQHQLQVAEMVAQAWDAYKQYAWGKGVHATVHKL